MGKIVFFSQVKCGFDTLHICLLEKMAFSLIREVHILTGGWRIKRRAVADT